MIGAVCAFVAAISPDTLPAGPPFRTDDPEPVDLHHWEIYAASQFSRDADLVSGTAPHFEVNNGALPNLQVHLIVPLAYARAKGGASYFGVGDMEFGVKYRFLQESATVPQIGTFPLVEVPTGDEMRGLGNGRAQLFLPLWLQKSWDPWTTYGGGGYWRNPGAGNRDYWFAGWEIQRDFSEHVTIGTEIIHATPRSPGEDGSTGFTLGAIVNFDQMRHLLISAGRDIRGGNLFSAYCAIQWTLGPAE